MMTKFQTYRYFIVAFALLLSAQGIKAQNMVTANPADSRNFKSTFVNPAILAFQSQHFAMGAKIFHAGFIDDGPRAAFKHGYAGLSLPTGVSDKMGLALQAQYFSNPLHSQSNISFGLSRKLYHLLAVGLRFNIFSKGYNQEGFDLVDPDDPVFRSGVTKWAGTFGAGVSMFPLPFLSLGIGIDHINRANISLINDDVYEPMAVYVGASVDWSSFYASFSASYDYGQWTPKTTFGTVVRNKGFATIGYENNAFEAEAQWRVSGPFSLNYNYELGLFEGDGAGFGSHSLSIIHDFGHRRILPEFEAPDDFRADFVTPKKMKIEEGQFYVYSVVDKMTITEKKLTRIIAPEISPQQLAQLTLREIGWLDPTRSDESIADAGDESVDMAKIPAMLESTLSRDYENYLKQVANAMNNNEVKARVLTPKSAYLRAAGLRRFFRVDSLKSDNVAFLEPVFDSVDDSLAFNEKLGQRQLKLYETLTKLSSNSTTFRVSPMEEISVKFWCLIVRNAADREMKSFSGTGNPPAKIRWDWNDESENIVAPGVYGYTLEWNDYKDNRWTTPVKYISVRKLLRNVTIEVTHEQKDTGVDADEIEIILKE